VKKPNQDDERLSALLEGRVQGQPREELLAHLSANEEDYAVFTSTASALRVLEEEDARAAAGAHQGVIPLRRTAPGPRVPPRWLAMAASIAAVALVSALALWSRGSGAGDPVRLAARAGQGLPANWNLAPWPAVRGSGSASPDQDAVRAGAMLMQLAIAAQAGDTTNVGRLARQLNERYGRGAGAGVPLARIADHPGAPSDSLAELIGRATDRLGRSLERRKQLELGAWVEAARLAAKHQNDEFFRGRATRGMLLRAARLGDDDAAARQAVDRVRADLGVNGPSRWAALEKSLTTLLIEIAS
jgi:hypothetical protein